MGKKLTVIVDDKIDKQFRETIFRRKGMRRGNLTDAVEEAMLLWIDATRASDVKKAEDDSALRKI